MPKKLNVSQAVLCDYVAPGQANKHVLVNAISGDVSVESFPAEISFGLYVELTGVEGQGRETKLEASLGGQELFAVGGVSQTDMIPGRTALIVVQHFVLVLKEEKLLEVFVSSPGFQRTLALRKRISVGPIPSTA